MKVHLLVLFFLPITAFAKVVKYDLVASKIKINLSGHQEVDFALAINNTIPAPVLEFTEGDEAEITVINNIPDQELSIHWHGILLPLEMDGVPYLTTPPIKTGERFIFKFQLRQSGTYWYHSHTQVQEQKGVYGAFIVHPKNEKIKVDHDVAVVLSDWSDENADQILKNLHKDGDYYIYKKNTMRSWWGAIRTGNLQNFLSNEWVNMGGMDYSDVGYDAFLINAKQNSQIVQAKAGQKIRLRIINAAASTYFYVNLGNQNLNVISADGINIKPVLAKEILMGMAETYDVLFEVPESKNYEFKITAQDGTGSASGWIGNGEKVFAPLRKDVHLYETMDHSSHSQHMAHQHHEHHSTEQIITRLTVDDVSSSIRTVFDAKNKLMEFKLVLDGDMERYVWHINGKAIHEERNIIVNEGDVIRFTFENKSMMHHPMHLHGHFFRVLNKYGEYSPLKHTVDVGPHSTRTIEFLANEPGEWMLHCHNLYHLKSGMARVVKYMTYKPSEKMLHYQKHDPHLHDHWYLYSKIEVASNRGAVLLRANQTWNQVDIHGEYKKHLSEWEFEGLTTYKRWLKAGANVFAGVEHYNNKINAIAGLSYLLPFLLESQIYVNHSGNIRFQIEKRFQWTSTVYSQVEAKLRSENTKEIDFNISLMYQNSWAWALGFMGTNDSLGFGGQLQF